MTKRPVNKLASVISASMLVIGLVLSVPQATAYAQTGDGSYKLFGVNVVGTLPMMNKNGQSTTTGDIQSLDGKMSIKIPLGTIIHNAAGKNQEFISATLVPSPSSLPAQQKSIIAYELGTPGAVFSSTVGLTFNYSDAELPPSVSESSLYIAQWDGSAWVKLISDVNATYNTVSTTIANFTTYALLGGVSPAVTSVPPSTSPTTSVTNPSTSPVQVSTATTSNPGTRAISPVIFIIGGGAIILIIVFILTSRKK